MKKIVGIIAALAMAAAVFADAPSVSAVVAEFDGNAKIEWQYNLDGESFGFKNENEASFKVSLVTGGTKETEGSPLWGELQISAGDWTAKYGDGITYKNIFKAKVKDASDNNAEKVWNYDPDTDTYTDDKKDDRTADVADIVQYPYEETLVAMPGAAEVKVAKIHFIQDDFYLNLDILAPKFEFSGAAIAIATSSAKDYPTASITLDDAAGFTVNFGLDGMFDADIKFADNGVKKSKEKKYAFGADFTLTAVEGLTLYAGFGYGTQVEKPAFAAKAAYKFELDDTLYIQPGVGFALKEDKTKVLNAGLLFGWGTEGQAAGFEKFTKANSTHKDGSTDSIDSVPDKCSDGVSIWVDPNIEDTKKGVDLLFGVYDSVLLAGLADPLNGLKAGLQFKGNTKTFDKAWELDFALAYAGSFDIITFKANFGLKALTAEKKTNTGMLFGVGVETEELIENTTLYINYKGQQAKKIGGINEKGAVAVGAKIHF